MQAVFNLASTTGYDNSAPTLNPVVSQMLNQVESDIGAAKELADIENQTNVGTLLEHAIDDSQRAKYLSTNGAAVSKLLQNVTDDLSLAKFEADKTNDRYMSQILNLALEDVAVSKFLNELVEQNSWDEHLTQFAEVQASDGADFGDIVDIDEGSTPLIFAGAGAFIPTPASVSAMLLGLEDGTIFRPHRKMDDDKEEQSRKADNIGDRPVTIFNVQGPLTIQQAPDYGLDLPGDIDLDEAAQHARQVEKAAHEERLTKHTVGQQQPDSTPSPPRHQTESYHQQKAVPGTVKYYDPN